jgi:hypothetical protein
MNMNERVEGPSEVSYERRNKGENFTLVLNLTLPISIKVSL